MEVGIIGIGIMGRAMARSLLRAGFRVWVWDRTRSKAEALAQEGAILAETPGELVENVEIVGIVLANHEVTREVFYRKEGVLEGIHEGVYIVGHGTNSPEWAPEFFMDALLHSAMASPYIKIKGEKILKQDFSKQFALSLMTKDLRLIIEEVLKHRFPSFLASVCYDVYQQAEVKGLGEVDLSAVKKMYQEK